MAICIYGRDPIGKKMENILKMAKLGYCRYRSRKHIKLIASVVLPAIQCYTVYFWVMIQLFNIYACWCVYIYILFMSLIRYYSMILNLMNLLLCYLKHNIKLGQIYQVSMNGMKVSRVHYKEQNHMRINDKISKRKQCAAIHVLWLISILLVVL